MNSLFQLIKNTICPPQYSACRKYWIKLLKQRLICGWDDSVCYNLNTSTAIWLLPKLRRYKEIHKSFPMGLTEKEWQSILDEIIWFLEQESADQDFVTTCNSTYHTRYDNARMLFGKYFSDLWS